MKRALVIDTSIFARRNFTSVLEKAGYAVTTASSGRNGLRLVNSIDPALVTLDMGITDMGVLSCLDEMTTDKWRPVVVTADAGAHSDELAKAVRKHGAAAAIEKPSAWDIVHDDRAVKDLVRTFTQASAVKGRPKTIQPKGFTKPPARQPAAPAPEERRPVARPAARAPERREPERRIPEKRDPAPTAPAAATAQPARPAPRRVARANFPVFLIGSSTGGLNALNEILPHLPADFPAAIVIAQHMPKRFTSAFATRMSNAMPFPAYEAEGPMEIRPGHCYIAAGGSDCVFKTRDGKIYISPETPLDGSLWVPSVDRLVDTAMRYVPVRRLRGVQLTGIGNDGARAMAELHKRGAEVIAESKESSVVFGMPGNLIAMGGASKVLHHKQIAKAMNEIV